MIIKATSFDTDGCFVKTQLFDVEVSRAEAKKVALNLAVANCKRLNSGCPYDKGESTYPPFQAFCNFRKGETMYDTAATFVNNDGKLCLVVGYEIISD